MEVSKVRRNSLIPFSAIVAFLPVAIQVHSARTCLLREKKILDQWAKAQKKQANPHNEQQ